MLSQTPTPYTQKHTVLPALRVDSAQSKRHTKLDVTETETEQGHTKSPQHLIGCKEFGFNKDKTGD